MKSPHNPDSLRLAAERLGRRWSLERVPAEVRQWWSAERAAPGSWIVMCSGGADSVALLLWLWDRFPDRRESFRVLHVNHGVRGLEAEEDATFVADLAHGLGVTARIVRRTPPAGPLNESALRQMRRDALRTLCAREPVEAAFTGHQTDDVAENLLFRLGRGSGLAGLSGLRPVQPIAGEPPRLRPLLRLTRAEIRVALGEAGVRWREDPSNAANTFTRNRLRATALPAWAEALGDRPLHAGVARSHAHLRDAFEAIEAWADAVERENAGARPELPVDRLTAVPAAVVRVLVARWWRRAAPDATPLGDETLDRLLYWLGESAPDRFSAGGRTIAWEGPVWRLVPESEGEADWALGDRKWTLHPGAALTLPDGGTLASAWRDLDSSLNSAVCAGEFSPSREVFLDGLEGPLLVRGWRPGDRFRPLGAPGTRKLQDAFTDAGISRPERHRRPVVCDPTGGIVWVPGLPPAHGCKLVTGTSRALWLTYTGS